MNSSKQQIEIGSPTQIFVQINFLSKNYGYIRLWLAGQEIKSLDEPQEISGFFLRFERALQQSELFEYKILSLGSSFDNYSFSYKKWDNDLEIVYRKLNTKIVGICLVDFSVIEKFINDYQPYFNIDFPKV